MKGIKENPEQNRVGGFAGLDTYSIRAPVNAVGLLGAVDEAPVPSDYKNYVVGTLLWAKQEEAKAQARFDRLQKMEFVATVTGCRCPIFTSVSRRRGIGDSGIRGCFGLQPRYRGQCIVRTCGVARRCH